MRQEHEYLDIAIEEARRSLKKGEFPVGAVLVSREGEIIARGHNLVYTTLDPMAHAEIVAIRKAALLLKNHQLNGLRMYVTLEPCVMCAGAIVISRIEEVVYVVREPKFGGVYSLYQIPTDIRLNHTVRVRQLDYRRQEIIGMMKAYFEKLR